MGHQSFEPSRAETDVVWILAGLRGVDVAAFVEIDVGQRRIIPVCEEVGEALVGEDFVVGDAEFGDILTILVNSLEDTVVDVVYCCEGQCTEVRSDGVEDLNIRAGGGGLVDLETEMLQFEEGFDVFDACIRDFLVVADLEAVEVWTGST